MMLGPHKISHIRIPLTRLWLFWSFGKTNFAAYWNEPILTFSFGFGAISFVCFKDAAAFEKALAQEEAYENID